MLWADAICINQNDFDERSEQVKLMANIYSTAYRTLIWLGEDFGNAAKAFSSIKWIRRQFPRQSPFNLVGASVGTRLRKRFERLQLSSAGASVFPWSKFEPVLPLLQLSWFRRKWIIQEVVKGNQPLLLCGDVILDWNILQDVMVYLKILAHKNLGELMVRNKTSLTALNHVNIIAMMKWEGYAVPSTLTTLLYMTRSFVCSDPRDHLIALLGLACDTGPDVRSIQADYKVSVAELSKQYVLWDIFQNRALSCFSSGFDHQTLSPSWVPDFTSRLDQFAMAREYFCFNATRDSQPCATLSEDRVVLSLEGKVLDEIENLGAISPVIDPDQLSEDINGISEAENLSQILDETLQLRTIAWFQECKSIALKGSASFNRQRLEGFCQSMLWDNLNEDNEKPSEALLEKFEELIEWGATPLPERDEAWRTRYAGIWPSKLTINFDMFTTGRRFAETRNARLGSMPKSTRVGDKICVFYGGNLPYVIRPFGEGKYTLVGDCYVHGFMYGEAMDMEDIETETIHLV
jgi:hypothetical protein